jgi:PAS domain S-box-containing protein
MQGRKSKVNIFVKIITNSINQPFGIIMENYDQELNAIKGVLRGTTKGLTVTEIARHIQINRNSVAKYLDILLTSGLVEMKAVGSAKIYSLTTRIPVSSILSLSSDYIFVLDNNSTITYVNENVLNFENKTVEEIVGKSADSVPLAFFSVPDIHVLIREGIGGKEVTREIEVRKDDHHFCFRAKFVPSILENRKKGLLLLLEDITEIKKYQKQLEKTVAAQDKELTTSYQKLSSEKAISKEVKGAFEESERRYHNLIEIAQEGVLTIDTEGMVTFTNKKFSEILGYSADEMNGRSIFLLSDEKNASILKRQVTRLKGGAPQCFTVTFTKKDGSPAYARLTASSGLDENGKFSYGLFLISDISELKKADEAIQQSELHYRTLVETMPNGVITINPQGVIQTANQHAANMLGYSKITEAIGNDLFDYIAPTDLEKCTGVMKRAAEKGFSKSTECTLISHDNTGFCAEFNISTIRDRDSTPAAFVCILSDITERRKAEYLVRKSEEKYRSLVEGVSNIIFTTDTKGKLTYVSPAIQRVLGYDPTELTGKHFYMLSQTDERHKIGLMLKDALSEKTGPEEFRMVDKTGSLHDVRIIAQPYKEKDKLAGINGLIEDITDRKKAEQDLKKIELQYKAVVEDQTDLICRFSPDFSLTFVNPAFSRHYVKPDGEILNKNLFSLACQTEQKKIQEIILSLTLDHPVKTFGHTSISPKGSTHSYHTTVRAIYNANGEATEFQLSSRDITELQQYYEKSQHLLDEVQLRRTELETQNEELRQLREEAERSERKYLDLYDHAPAGYFTLAPNGIITGVNLTGAALLGKSREQVLNSSLQSAIPPENRDTFIAFCKRIFESSRKQKCELTLIQSDTSERLVIQADGKRIEQEPDGEKRCRIVITDISDRVKAEKTVSESEGRLRKMIDGSPVPIFVINKNHEVTHWNKAMSACSGINSKDMVGTNQHWKGFYSHERPCLVDLVVDGDNDAITTMYPNIASKSALIDGAYETIDFFPSMGEHGKWFHFTASPLFDTQQNIVAALETVVDITDLKLAEETVISANKKLNALTKITRHDIINQLTILLGYVVLLEQTLPEDAGVKKLAGTIKNAASNIQHLIVFTREYQNLGMEMARWHALDQLVQKAVDTTNAHTLNIHIDPTPVSIYADPLIERVFENLVDNSIRYGETVSEIRVSFDGSNHTGKIIFEDNGVGIPTAEKTKIFRKGAGKTPEFGLFLSKEILDYHGISIQETGEPGKGARFEIDVPKARYKVRNSPSIEHVSVARS